MGRDFMAGSNNIAQHHGFKIRMHDIAIAEDEKTLKEAKDPTIGIVKRVCTVYV